MSSGETMSNLIIAQALVEIKEELAEIRKALTGGSIELADLQKDERDE